MREDDKRKLILVIEDEADVLSFSARVLELEGHRVLTARDADSGLEIAGSNQVSLVVLDLRLPGKDEWYGLGKFKNDPKLKDIPVIVFAASAASSQRDKARGMGAADYVVKPVSAAALKNSVANVLQSMQGR